MAVSEDFVAHVQELLAGLGTIRVKKMFGAAGIYAGDLFFGVIDDETLYLKVDDLTAPEFQAAGSKPAVLQTKDGPMTLRFWSLPDEAADDPEAAERWARLALDAALRAKKPKKKGAARADIGPGPWDG
ncbi:MAG TPA: TfoX/Sxy family protein [Arenibaculum sp.]|nr:TfoX/Sxy family protein [Arenibaculum sp.]